LLRDQCERLENERSVSSGVRAPLVGLSFIVNNWRGGAPNCPGIVDQPRTEDRHGGALDGSVGSVPPERPAHVVVIRDLDVQLQECKRKYEQAKTELSSVKGGLSFYSHIHSILILIR
jgi:hypothetical protein